MATVNAGIDDIIPSTACIPFQLNMGFQQVFFGAAGDRKYIYIPTIRFWSLGIAPIDELFLVE
jgi:hypothetical protein